ncbi:MAG: ATP-dependent helicase RuvA [Gammaproteobacteria bacterium]|nr:ATP-dependent helicase RuvA [Gammaproteobacteria bacterium]
MIGRIQGILVEKQPPHLLVDVAGVGYEIEAPMSTFYQLPELGQTLTLHTHLAVREDAHVLYGFYELRERSLFRQLIKVNGVGPKLALTILSSIDPDQFVHSILENDASQLVRLPGIGKKTAERLIIEMRDRLKTWYEGGSPLLPSLTPTDKPSIRNAEQEAISELLALGYKPQEASRAVNQVADKETLACEQIIRSALKNLAK